MSPEGFGVFGGSVEEKSDVHVTQFSLGSSVEIPFVEVIAVQKFLYAVPLQVHRFFIGVFGSWVFLLEGCGVISVYSVVIWDSHWSPFLA